MFYVVSEDLYNNSESHCWEALLKNTVSYSNSCLVPLANLYVMQSELSRIMTYLHFFLNKLHHKICHFLQFNICKLHAFCAVYIWQRKWCKGYKIQRSAVHDSQYGIFIEQICLRKQADVIDSFDLFGLCPLPREGLYQESHHHSDYFVTYSIHHLNIWYFWTNLQNGSDFITMLPTQFYEPLSPPYCIVCSVLFWFVCTIKLHVKTNVAKPLTGTPTNKNTMLPPLPHFPSNRLWNTRCYQLT